jgi:hypothetical protein
MSDLINYLIITEVGTPAFVDFTATVASGRAGAGRTFGRVITAK